MNKVSIIILSLVFSLLFPSFTNAALAENCTPIYGGGKTCLPQDKISVDKKVQSPVNDKLLDDLSQAEARYRAGDTITFELTIVNKSNKTLKEIEATDKLPSFIKFISGPGNFNEKTKTLTFRFNNLKPDESRKFIVVGIVNNIDKSACVVNYVSVKSGKIISDDNSKFCLEKTVYVDGFPVMSPPNGLNKTPATGPGILPLLSLLPLGLAGFYIRKKV